MVLTQADPSAVPIAVVVGLPGVGKTALALTWAHAASRHFPDGVLHVDLNGWARDQPVAAEEVLPGWLRALGLEPADLPDDLASRAACLRTALTGRNMLLVLDNAASEEQVRPLLPGSSTCAVLVTSRHVMRGLAVHEGAQTVRLDVLAEAESIELFRRSVGPRVDLDPTRLRAWSASVGGSRSRCGWWPRTPAPVLTCRWPCLSRSWRAATTDWTALKAAIRARMRGLCSRGHTSNSTPTCRRPSVGWGSIQD